MAVRLPPPAALWPVAGVTLAAASAGIYPRRRPDLCLMAFAPGSCAAGVFTRNAFCAAPVQVARAHLETPRPRYCLINAGNANAGTGRRGVEDALRCCEAVAQAGACSPGEVLPFSTGVIGEFLPVEAIRGALPSLHARLSGDAWLDCARAIMTTDTVAKGASRRFEFEGVPITVTGIAKGSGMIHPRMATLLAFIATDAPLEAGALRALLRTAVDASFHRISVDGDTSTNDAVLLVATSKAPLAPARARAAAFQRPMREALDAVCLELAQAVIRDGEGATKFVTVGVEQGADEAECVRVAETVAASPLVKTALSASDPNWGRILAAVGRAGLADLDVSRVAIWIGDVCIVAGGARAPGYTEAAGKAVMSRDEIEVRILLGRGTARAALWTCDLSHGYVTINAEYRS